MLHTLAARLWALTVAVLCIVPAAASAAEGPRYALAIGINNYAEIPKLDKAVSDARAVGRALERVGFRVTVVTNVNRTEMNRAINQFVANLSGGGQGVFFFAGHGLQINNQNFLLPVDVKAPQFDADVADQAVSLQGIQDKLAEVRAKFTLLVVDACRDNPLPRKAGRTVGATRGLAQASSAEGQMVVFSAGANQQALDKLSDRDTHPNGVFTREFLPWIEKPGVSIRDAVLQVRSAVRARARSANHEQFPAVYDQVEGNFYFVSGYMAQTSSGAATPATASAPSAGAVDPAELAYWTEVTRLNDLEAYAAYLRAYPSGYYASAARGFIDREKRDQEAKARLAEDQAWKRAEQGASAASYGAYLTAYPNGRFVPLARLKFERLGVVQDCAGCPEMVPIPAGSFVMGSPGSEIGRYPDEGPQRRVTLTSFVMSKTEITRKQFAHFVAATGYLTDAERSAGGRQGCFTLFNGQWDWRASRNWRDPGFEQDDSHPVVCLSWQDAQSYVRWLSEQTGQKYRLPTEAQWEYAARAGESGPRPWGESPNDACRHANVADQTQGPGGASWKDKHECGDGYFFTAPTGRYQANRFGLHDMIGNVWEWTEDCYSSSYFGASSDGSARAIGACDSRVVRGSSWVNVPALARLAVRDQLAPVNRFATHGFRVVRDVP